MPNDQQSYQAGKVGTALSLDGNHHVNIPYVNNPNAFTIAGWIKPAFRNENNDPNKDIIAPPMNVFVRTDASGPTAKIVSQLSVFKDEGAYWFEYQGRSNLGTHIIRTSVQVLNQTWYHVAVTAESNGMLRLYINGKEEGVSTLIGSLPTTTIDGGDRYHIGNRTTIPNPDPQQDQFIDNAYSGLVDDFRIYERALAAREVESIIDGKANPEIVVINPTVTVKTIDSKAAETSGDTGLFTITRDGSTLAALVVNYAFSGTATNNSDYTLATSVTIPAGQSSVFVTLTPTDDATNDPSETVILTLTATPSYNVDSALGSATAIITDNEAAGDYGWLGSNNTGNGNNFGFKSTNVAGGSVTGEVGGVFAKLNVDAFFGDANLAAFYTLNNTITASGKFDFQNLTSATGGWADNDSGTASIMIGHFSQSTVTGKHEFIGFEFRPSDSVNTIRVRANYIRPDGNNNQDSTDFDVSLDSPTENHTFSYTYTPNADPSLDNTLSLTIDGGTPLVATITDGARNGDGSTFDSFGIGYVASKNTPVDAADTAEVYMDDLSYTGLVSTQVPIVSITASDATAVEQGAGTGTFVVSRTGSTTSALTVNIAYSGTAIISGTGDDYNVSPTGTTSVTIASGQSALTITVTPIDDSTAELDETVTLSLTSSANYQMGVNKSATVTIRDNEPIVTITAADAAAAETGSNTGTFVVTRMGSTSSALTVNIAYSGTATISGTGDDYDVSPTATTTVSIASGQSSATVTVTPINDSTLDGSETVTMAITSGTAYSIGSSSRATVTIADDDAPGLPTGTWTGVQQYYPGQQLRL